MFPSVVEAELDPKYPKSAVAALKPDCDRYPPRKRRAVSYSRDCFDRHLFDDRVSHCSLPVPAFHPVRPSPGDQSVGVPLVSASCIDRVLPKVGPEH